MLIKGSIPFAFACSALIWLPCCWVGLEGQNTGEQLATGRLNATQRAQQAAKLAMRPVIPAKHFQLITRSV